MDIETLKEEVSIADVLAYYDADVDLSVGWRSVRCPFHGDDNPSASVNVDIGQFYCFVCDVHGDIIDVVKTVEALPTIKEAKDWIEEVFLG